MKLIVPSYYVAEYTAPRKRSSERVLLNTKVEVEINETDTLDAPVVHVVGQDRVSDTWHNLHQIPCGKIDGEPVMIRFYEGRLYYQISSVEKFLTNVESVGFDNPFTVYYGDGVIAGRPKTSSLKHSAETTAEYEHMTGVAVRKWNIKLEETHAAIANRADSFLIVDGQVYDRIGEPYLAVEVRDTVVLKLYVTEDPSDNFLRFIRTNPDALTFGLDEYQRAVKEGMRIASDANLSFSNRAIVKHVTPWHVRYRGDGLHLYKGASAFISSTARLVQYMNPMLGMAWRRLADAVGSHQSITSGIVDRVTDILALKDHLKSDLVSAADTHNSDVQLNKSLKQLEDAMHIWNSRDSQCIEWLDNGLKADSTFENNTRAWEITSLIELDMVSEKIGIDLSEMFSFLQGGSSHLVVVEKDHQPSLVCLVRNDNNEPIIADYITKRDVMDEKEDQLALALKHVKSNTASSFELDNDQLAQFGL